MTKHVSYEWPDLDDEDLQMAYELKIPISAFDLPPSAFVQSEKEKAIYNLAKKVKGE